MNADRARWSRIKELFEAARGLPDAQRADYLRDACGGDATLHREVESLLASYEKADTFLEKPAAEVFDRLAMAGPLDGRTIGPYAFASRIGAGGMGDVYKARDTRLDRTVAIKVLTAEVAGDSQARSRFEREARAVAALNHPHISTLYDVGSQDGVNFLVMEFIDGETLSARLAKGALPIPQALEYAIQIASALDRAHRAGIVHRDLKPGNIMLTAAGTKLLDFGLAKPGAVPGVSGLTRLEREVTGPGVILGTAQYMAPEQIEGKDADPRTDLFAFGAVLHEMLTGKKAFDAPTNARLIAAILSSEPAPVSQLEPGVPASLDYVVSRCLAKDPDDRWQTARDLLAELKRSTDSLRTASARLPESIVAQSGSRRARPASWVAGGSVAMLAIVMVAAVGSILWSRAPVGGDVIWFSIFPPPAGFDLSPDPAVSPDGRHVIYKAQDASHRTQIWLKSFDAPDAHPIPGTEGTDFTAGPFWSPDNRAIGFFAQGKLKRIEIGGGTALVLAAAPEPRGGTWTPSGVIIFNADTQNLMQVSASGGTPTLIANPANGGVRLFPHALSDGRRYLFTSRNANGLGQGVYVGTVGSPEVRRISSAWSPSAYAGGHLFFAQQSTLFAQPFDLASGATNGEPKRIGENVGIGYGTPLSYPFSASGRVIAYWSGLAQRQSELVAFDRSGTRIAALSEPAITAGFSVSRQGTRATIERYDRATSTTDVWMVDLRSQAGVSRVTSDGRFSAAVLSPDGEQLVAMERGRGLVRMAVAGGASTVIVEGPASKWPASWSPDGTRLVYVDSTMTGWRLLTAGIAAGTKPVVYRDAPFALSGPQVSPDGHWLAYASDESGRLEIYVDTFPTPSSRQRVSTNGGAWPKWRRDVSEFYYLAPDRSLMMSTVTADGDALAFSPPRALFEGPGVNPDTTRTQFEPSADGSRFYFNARVEDRNVTGLTVISNWPALLKK